jgi:hypothetical protein
MERYVSVAFSAVGVVCLGLAVAAFFGLNDKVTLSAKDTSAVTGQGGREPEIRLPSFASAGAASGFAIASGLCFVAAALANRWGRFAAQDGREEKPKASGVPAAVPKEAPKGESNISQLPPFPG